MPNALLESMASALPAVATRIAGNEELVVDGETGLLIPPDDSEALKTTLHTLISDAELRKQMGKAARQPH
jgi:glycosyltransferase involved in cell wall biosynthesis